jgi:hypothetical protein
MGSVPGPYRGHSKSRAAAEIEAYKRDLVIQLWKRGGSFWEEVGKMRERWKVVAETGLPKKCKIIALMPPQLDRAHTLEEQEVYARWCSELSEMAGAVIPKPLLGSYQIGSYHSPDDWEPFLSACVLFDPPDTELDKFADLGPFLSIGTKTAAMPAPPIRKMHDPYEERQVYGKAWSAAADALFDLYLKPLGFEPEQVWQEVHEARPDILRVRSRELQDLPLHHYIEVNELTTWDDLKTAFKIITEDREDAPSRGRPKRDRLVCVQCAILHDRYGWTYEQIAERNNWLDHTLTGKYIKDGRKLLGEI